MLNSGEAHLLRIPPSVLLVDCNSRFSSTPLPNPLPQGERGRALHFIVTVQ